MSHHVVLIVPTLNEAGAIAAALAGVSRSLVNVILVADGGSTDATCSEARAAGAQIVAAGRGYGRACWTAAVAAEPQSILVFMDGDGGDRADLIHRLVGPIIAGDEDFVIASRVRGERARGSMGPHQIAIGFIMGLLIKMRYGVRYTDMCAFRAIPRELLLSLGMKEMTYGWNLEMQMRAAKARLRILEIPLPYNRRVAGSSKVAGNLRGSLRAGTQLLSTFLRIACEPGRFSRPQGTGGSRPFP